MGDWQVQRFCSWVLVTSCPAKVIINMGWPIGLKYALALKLVFDPAVRHNNSVLVWYLSEIWVNDVLVWYLSESCVTMILSESFVSVMLSESCVTMILSELCVSVMLSESFLWFLYEATPHLTTYKISSTSWRWPIYQTGTESLSVVSTDPCWFHVSLSVMSNTVVCFLVEYAKVTLGLRKALHHENNNFTFVVFFPSPLLLHLLLSSVLLFFLCRIVSLSVPFFNLPPSLCLWWQTSLISCMRRPCQSWRRAWRPVRMLKSHQSREILTSCQRSSLTSETPQPWPHSSPERQDSYKLSEIFTNLWNTPTLTPLA